VIDTRLKILTIADGQIGFMPNRSTTDAIFALRQMIEKHWEGQENLHCVFINLEKAETSCEDLWACVSKPSIPEEDVPVVQVMYEGC